MSDYTDLVGSVMKAIADPFSAKLSNGYDYTEDHHDTYEYINPRQFNLSGRSVLITGASRGVGRAAAISFAKAGCTNIALAARGSLDVTEAELLKAAETFGRATPTVLTLKMDVANPNDVQKAAHTVRDTFGRLDIVINNAGILGQFIKIIDNDPYTFLDTFKTNIFGQFLVAKYFVPLLLESQNSLKVIINTSSVAAHMPMAGGSAYCITKFSTLRFTEILQLDYEDDGLVAISLHPGGIMTELTEAMPQAIQAACIDTPEMAGDTIVWLTAESREWATGRYVSGNWDMQEIAKRSDEIVKNNELKVRMRVGGPPGK